MIAQIAYVPDLPQPVVLFLRELEAAGFEGDIDSSDGMRSVMSTDNSIYQQRPQALLFPKHEDDVQRIARLAGQPMHRKVTLTPRGGGTGTNGQSLTTGIVVDLSKYLNKIVDIDVVNRRVHVQAGVVKDQLNAALKPHGLFFAPELSTSNRATIGGMIATDASGQGSCTYGKTRHHVIALDSVFIGGCRHTSRSIDAQELERLSSRDDAVGMAYRTAAAIAVDNKDEIARTFPRLNRSMTGYDLAHLQEASGVFNLNSVICGAEGTLAMVVGATLNVLPIPRHTALVNICYSSFMDALRDAQALMQHRPLSIETVDSKVLSLAMKDPVWLDIARYFPDHPRGATLGINLVEFVAEDLESLNALLTAFTEGLTSTDTSARLGYTIAEGHAAVDRLYAMRKRAVGLLGNMNGEARPQPFVEDTAVPPEHLAQYIEEFRALLDRYELTYGMFGHVDAGVLHVRPALDLKNPDHAALVRPISDAVVALTQKYGGVLWGEHGKGVRSEYVPAFFGSLYPALRRLKGAFDPNNQLNPGKIASAGPALIPLLKIDEVPLRGEHDRQIDERVWTSYGNAMHCNGNGACYNFDPDDAMCPSWKGTRDRIHSPKGRASLIREWLRLQQRAGVDVLAVVANPPSLLGGALGRWRTNWGRRKGPDDFSHQVYDAMAGCLACKSCAGQCPVKVNVPAFRSRFLQLYHTRYGRPIRDYVVGALESTVPLFARAPRLYNAMLSTRGAQWALRRVAGLVDSPEISRYDWNAALRRANAESAHPDVLCRLTEAERRTSVIIVQDAFTRYFDTPVAAAFIELAKTAGCKVYIAPFLPNGKPLHVQGFLPAFERTARRNAAHLRALASFGIPLVGLDPAMTLTYRQEYPDALGKDACPSVALPQEWLFAVLPRRTQAVGRYRLAHHCTEISNAPQQAGMWVSLFERAGLDLEPQRSGCCGMSGTYGHEARNVETSRKIFDQSWAAMVDPCIERELLATGYSCRSQAMRLRSQSLRHPVEVLLEHYRQSSPGSKPGALIQ